MVATITGEVISESGEYKYKGVELTPMVFADLMILLFDGKLFSRQDGIDAVVAYHTGHGGMASKGSYVSVFKRGMNRFLGEWAVNVSYGMWRLNYRFVSAEPVLVREPDVLDGIEDNVANIDMSIDRQIGEGDGAVYVYYYDIYKSCAEAKGLNTWACKVGMTNRDALSRVFSQVGTAYPEAPHIGLVIKSDSAKELELILHSVLKLRGRHMIDAPGKEWFLTSPDEVESIYNAVM